MNSKQDKGDHTKFIYAQNENNQMIQLTIEKVSLF
jgi:hypothetical protein